MANDYEVELKNAIDTDLTALTFNDDATTLFNDIQPYYEDFTAFQGNSAIFDFDQIFNETNTNQQDLYRTEFIIYTREVLSEVDQTTINTRVSRQDNILQALRQYVTEIPNNLGVVNGYQILNSEIVNVRMYKAADDLGVCRYMEFKFLVRGSINVRGF